MLAIHKLVFRSIVGKTSPDMRIETIMTDTAKNLPDIARTIPAISLSKIDCKVPIIVEGGVYLHPDALFYNVVCSRKFRILFMG